MTCLQIELSTQSSWCRRPAPLRVLNPLEYAGWAVVAADTLCLPTGEAKVLRAMVFAPGRSFSPEQIQSQFRRRDHGGARQLARRSVSTAIARIRSAIADIGLARTAIINEPDAGYSITADAARSLRQIVECE